MAKLRIGQRLKRLALHDCIPGVFYVLTDGQHIAIGQEPDAMMHKTHKDRD